MGWHDHLLVRYGLEKALVWRKTTLSHALSDRELEMLECLRAAPLVDVTANKTMSTYFFTGAAIRDYCRKRPRYFLGARLSTVRDFYQRERKIFPDKRAYAHGFFAEFHSSDIRSLSEIKFPYKDWIDEPLDAIGNGPGNTANVTVDLDLPDSVLIDDFTRLLESLHKPLFPYVSEPSDRANFADWIAFGVLPYIDLKLWERETGVKIPNRVMADAIFPPGEGGEEVVRKTTRKIADDLLTDKRLKFLAAIATKE